MIANEDPILFIWLTNARERGGSFVKALAEVAFRADTENYDILWPALVKIAKKYPEYHKERA